MNKISNEENEDYDFQEEESLLKKLKSYLGFSSDHSIYHKLLEIIQDYNHTNKNNIKNEDIQELHLLKNVLLLRNKKAKDIMIPRANIVAINISSTLKEIIEILKINGLSRIPVYKDNLDEIVGFIHAKDLINNSLTNTNNFSVEKLLRQVIFISPFMYAIDILYELKSKICHMAMVVDEFGGICGIITMEDIFEEIVGDITDEYDIISASQQVNILNNNSLECDAKIDLSVLEATIGNFLTPKERKENNTLAGLIIFLLGRIPSKSEIIKHSSGVEFEIISSDSIKINKIIVHHKVTK